jgi:hypothetical protein
MLSTPPCRVHVVNTPPAAVLRRVHVQERVLRARVRVAIHEEVQVHIWVRSVLEREVFSGVQRRLQLRRRVTPCARAIRTMPALLLA